MKKKKAKFPMVKVFLHLFWLSEHESAFLIGTFLSILSTSSTQAFM